MMVWGEDAEVKVLENQNKICSAMYDDEKNDYTLLSRHKKQEIAEITQLQLSDVQDVIHKYIQMGEFHNWLKQKQSRKEPMPESRDELMQMYRIERPSFLMPKGHRAGAKKS
jgi:signal recognition particle GTPase